MCSTPTELLWGLVGWQVAMICLGFGLLIAIVAGWVIGRFHLEGWLQDRVRYIHTGGVAMAAPEMTILRKVLKFRLIAVFIGVVGSGILAVGFLFNAIFRDGHGRKRRSHDDH